MPCFSSGPPRGTPEYDEWLPGVQNGLNSFTGVVDYYYGKAGLPMPQPHTYEDLRAWRIREDEPSEPRHPADEEANARVLRQILLHLDCDGVDVFRLNDILNYLLDLMIHEPTPRRLGYFFVLEHCFAAMRGGDV